MKKIIALIPARGGSKGVPGKNIKSLGGFPVLAYSILAAQRCPEIDRVVVSTDAAPIADMARLYGAEVPFMRPAELAGDASPDWGLVVHALDWFRDHEGEEPDLLVHLRPTTPLRDPKKMGEALRDFLNRPEATALRSAHPLPEPPQKMLQICDGFFEGFFPEDPRPEYYNLPRQLFPTAYCPNGYIDILSTRHIRSSTSLHGPKILAFKTPHAIEIDEQADFDRLEYLLDRSGHPLHDLLYHTFPNLASVKQGV